MMSTHVCIYVHKTVHSCCRVTAMPRIPMIPAEYSTRHLCVGSPLLVILPTAAWGKGGRKGSSLKLTTGPGSATASPLPVVIWHNRGESKKRNSRGGGGDVVSFVTRHRWKVRSLSVKRSQRCQGALRAGLYKRGRFEVSAS